VDEETIMNKQMGLRLAAASLSLALCFGAAIAQDTTSDDKKFIADASQGSLWEINISKLALQKSGDPNVKMFAETMVKDHAMLIDSMKPLAQKLGAKEPTGPTLAQKASYAEMKMKSGISFDRAYVEKMVKDHHEDLQKFMEEEQKTTNPEVKAAVAKGEKVVRHHMEMIDSIARKGGIDVPATPGS
jgi:putative membrane protein